MWNPFQEAREAKERAEKAEALLQVLKDKMDEEEAEKKAVLAEKQRVERLAAEEKERKDAEKNLATQRKEPYISIVNITVDGDQITEGEIELDWNDIFIQELKRQGYAGASDEDLVEQWFKDVCRHVVLETYEQSDSDLGIERKPSRKDLGDGTVEYT